MLYRLLLVHFIVIVSVTVPWIWLFAVQSENFRRWSLRAAGIHGYTAALALSCVGLCVEAHMACAGLACFLDHSWGVLAYAVPVFDARIERAGLLVAVCCLTGLCGCLVVSASIPWVSGYLYLFCVTSTSITIRRAFGHLDGCVLGYFYRW